jgi:hypothetical protein
VAKPRDTAFLEQHGPSWRVRVKVPDRLRPVLGVSKLVVPLHTDSLALANRDKHKHIHALKQRLAAAEVELRRQGKAHAAAASVDTLVAEGLDWRQSFKEDDEDGYTSTALEARWEEVAKAQGEERADTLAAIATGRAMPIGLLADQWLAEKPLKGKQRLDYRRAVAKLETWMAGKSMPPTLQASPSRWPRATGMRRSSGLGSTADQPTRTCRHCLGSGSTPRGRTWWPATLGVASSSPNQPPHPAISAPYPVMRSSDCWSIWLRLRHPCKPC